MFFPTCRVRVVRFYVSCLLLSSSSPLLLLNRDPRRTVFSVGPQPRPSTPSVPCRTSTTTIHAQCSLPNLNREYPRQVFPAGPHVGRYGTKNVHKKVRKNVRQNARQNARSECQIECQKECQIGCQIRMPDRMSESMSDKNVGQECQGMLQIFMSVYIYI